MPFERKNYICLGLGVLLIMSGFVCMALERAPYGFGVLALNVAPITILGGYALLVLAIFIGSNKESS